MRVLDFKVDGQKLQRVGDFSHVARGTKNYLCCKFTFSDDTDWRDCILVAAFTIRICSNEKNFPKRYRWTITSKIVNEAVDICRYIRKANKCVLNREMLKEYKKRRKYQNKALNSIGSMELAMDAFYKSI